jgi:transcriptional regulator with XRE-family HTH domain
MPTLAATLKNEIRRLAAREFQRALRSLKRVQRQVKNLRLSTRGHKRTLAKIERRMLRLKTAVGVRRGRVPGGAGGPRMSPESIHGLRARLRMTRVQFADLLGVSPGSIFGWETGRTIPRGSSLERLAEVRKSGARPAAGRSSGRKRGRKPSRKPRRRARTVSMRGQKAAARRGRRNGRRAVAQQ